MAILILNVSNSSFLQNNNLLMVSSRGQKFSCLFPKLQTDTPSFSDTKGQDVTEKFPNVSKILLSLTERSCLLKVRGVSGVGEKCV